MNKDTRPSSLGTFAQPLGILARLKAVLKHLWMDESDTRRAVPAALAETLARRIASGESVHAGEVRLCVEAALPLSYLWRLLRSGQVLDVVRERARMMFSKLGVWDTEHNTGVLVYVLLAEHAIEVVADRGLQSISQADWQAVAQDLAQAFREGRAQEGLLQALDQCQALLKGAGLASDAHNELADPPLLK